MKEITFDNKSSLIFVQVTIKKTDKIVDGVFVLDTGCSTTVVQRDFLERCGYTKKDFAGKTNFTTGSKKEVGNFVKIKTLKSLDHTRSNFKVISYALPLNFQFDGLLGTDFLKNKDLLISFKRGVLTLS